MRKLALVGLLVVVSCGGAAATSAPPTPPQPPTFHPTSFNVQVSGNGRPVIFIPGLTCDGSVWDGTVAHLGGKVQAHVLSLAGFAGVPPIAAPLLPTVHDELVRDIAENHLDHPVLVGHSLGGFMAFWVAETAPAADGGVVAADGAPFFPALRDPASTPATAEPMGAAMRDQLATQTPDAFKAGIAAFLGRMITKDADRQSVGAAAGKSDPRTTADAMFFLFTHDARADVGKIAAPVLVIAADGGGELPRAPLEQTWHAQIDAAPKHELVVVDHARHFVMVDQPEAFYAALDKFLSGR